MLNKISPEQLQRALNAFMAELPQGTALHAIRMTPRVGFGDDAAGGVAALVLADSDEDFKRFRQIVDRGAAEFQGEYGLTASLERQAEFVVGRAQPHEPQVTPLEQRR